ncbi:MAG: prephenate dehydrogenase/arogenate dehydrogenase family protein [Planctomycetaceae bacterium]|nr:prephenate dehydrogenase/arogenate dehydrogenase family protein [Planctomycetaceae bacterium]
MRTWNTVAIIGVGLIGGSIGLALRTRNLANRVVGIGRRQESLATALGVGAITEATTEIAPGVADADLIVVATPVGQIVEHVRQAAAACPARALLTDAGSTKGEIVAALSQALAPSARFIGSHPIAGGEKQGPAEARPDLFVERLVVLTPTAATPPEVEAAVTEFWESLGARTRRLSPEEHDRQLACSSHVPHLVAAMLAQATDRAALPFTGTGFRDTTRVAAGDPELWTQILLANRGPVLAALAPFEAALGAVRDALEHSDARALRQALQEAKNKRDAVGS